MNTDILAIESSCDETAAAVVRNGRKILSNVVYSQIDVHALYGGVVPEIASRAHVEKIDFVVKKALEDAQIAPGELAAIACTYGPGLVGALLVGVSYAKAYAYALQKPCIPVNHIEGHIAANYLTHPSLYPPYLCLVASGGHSHLILVKEDDSYELIGCTQDDAAGEAFDKAARILDLEYPGGPKLDALAETGNDEALALPVPRTEGVYDFSFSGLKTAFINEIHRMKQKGISFSAADMAASFRKSVVSSMVHKTALAAHDLGIETIVLAGGVSANRLLRREMQILCKKSGKRLFMPELCLCGDNAAMIGAAAYIRNRHQVAAGLDLNAVPSLRLL